tara:strand:- start:119 stop:457 length:339 start_codon:yes stop_codon:yes gene_type:complete
MKLLFENWRGFLYEATEYDEHFARILDSDAPGQAIELAKSLDIPLRELPWNWKRIGDYIRSRVDWALNPNVGEYALFLEEKVKVLEEIGISEEEFERMWSEDIRLRRSEGRL